MGAQEPRCQGRSPGDGPGSRVLEDTELLNHRRPERASWGPMHNCRFQPVHSLAGIPPSAVPAPATHGT